MRAAYVVLIFLKIVLCVTGASGAAYAVRLAQELKKAGAELSIVVTDSAKKVFAYEEPGALAALRKCGKTYSEDAVDAPFASGSAKFDAVVVCPCSMKTLAAISCGFAYNSVCRAADVALKERKKLVLVPRETPLHEIHLENMLKLARMGAVILPACPGFYHSPKKAGDLADFVVGKVLDSLGVENNVFKRWKA